MMHELMFQAGVAKSKRKSEGIKLIPFILLLILYIPRMHMHIAQCCIFV